MSVTGSCLFLTLIATTLVAAVLGEGGWRWGRGTYYGDQPWLWDIHKGSCGYGYLDYHKGTGWDIAALPDVHYEHHGSCGRCYEVKCDPRAFKDNYGNHLDRKHVCKDPEKVVKLTITDTCPCNYPDNHYSNKRWCCGDIDHLDLSYTVFDKLADRKWGVIGLKYRPVACDSSSPPPEKKTEGEGSRLYWLKNALQKEGYVQAFGR